MKFAALAVLAAAQMALAPKPAASAELIRDAGQDPLQVGSFAGARIRVPLGATKEKPHAGLALAATQRSGDSATLRFSKGLELGFAGDDKVRLSLAGQPVSKLVPGARGPEGRKMGVSTLGWIGIGAGVIVIGTAVWFYATITDEDRCCE
jgi:hypothetical protein